MTEFKVFQILLTASFIMAAGTFVTLFFVSAPYGRHARRGWGPPVPNWLGWVLMEGASPIAMLVLFFIGDAPKTTTTVVFLLMWQAHYVHRSFIYPFTLRDGRKKMPLAIPLMAAGFNIGNAYINGRYLFHYAGDHYTEEWLFNPRFVLGAMLFAGGYFINRWADNSLRNLRQPGESGYKIPYGGFYKYISCPNYLGEILEWFGWAICTWSLSGLAFAIWTVANLAPRARSHHNWYHDEFPEYPQGRKALIPGVW